ncbi:MAG TPA: ATP-binding protein [bacterium]|nr:ATP-binding protein [bacterium]
MGPYSRKFVAPLQKAQVEQLRRELLAWLSEHAFPADTAYRVATVVDELFCNTMEYSGAGWTEVEAEIRRTDVSVTLRDDGVAFDPFKAGQKDYSVYLASDTDRRLGLYLVTRLARQVDYRREDGANEVRFMVEAEPPDPGQLRRRSGRDPAS